MARNAFLSPPPSVTYMPLVAWLTREVVILATSLFTMMLTLLQIFTGLLPFAELSTRGRKYNWQGMFLIEVVERGRRPQKPSGDSLAFSCYGLTDKIWDDMMETCWDHEARRRPSADELSKLPFLVAVLDDRPNQE
jgi:hypothetical protein